MNLTQIKQAREDVRLANNAYGRAVKTLVGKKVLICRGKQAFHAEVLKWVWDGRIRIKNLESSKEYWLEAHYVAEILEFEKRKEV